MAFRHVFPEMFVSTSRSMMITVAFAIAVVLYWVSLAIYRLYLSPLAKVPGPTLAALTQWTETYYEILHGHGGQFLFQYRKWHEQYGPIVRISPDEVHIQDSEFFEFLYSSTQKLEKPKHPEHRFNNPLSTFATPKYNTHRMRRAALNPFFSTRKMAQHSPVIQRRVDRLCDNLQTEYVGNSKVLVMDDMWGCLTSDTIVEYCFDRSYRFIDQPNFRAFFIDAINDLVSGIHVATQFPWIVSMINCLPDSVVKWMRPAMASVIDFNNEMSDQIDTVLKASTVKNLKKPSKTVFTALLESDLPPEKLSPTRLQHEAISLIGAGIETTKRALSVASFHIVSNPAVLARRRSVRPPFKPPHFHIPLAITKHFFFLTCTALRLSYGTSQRTPHVSSKPITYASHILPPGTVISMSNISVSHDEVLFPDSNAFKPERWLGNPKAPNGSYLSRYMVSFGKGTRSCLGITLAYAEMCIAMATVFRRCGFELFETNREAVDCWKDMFVAHPKSGTLGVRARVQSVEGNEGPKV